MLFAGTLGGEFLRNGLASRLRESLQGKIANGRLEEPSGTVTIVASTRPHSDYERERSSFQVANSDFNPGSFRPVRH